MYAVQCKQPSGWEICQTFDGEWFHMPAIFFYIGAAMKELEDWRKADEGSEYRVVEVVVIPRSDNVVMEKADEQLS